MTACVTVPFVRTRKLNKIMKFMKKLMKKVMKKVQTNRISLEITIPRRTNPDIIYPPNQPFLTQPNPT